MSITQENGSNHWATDLIGRPWSIDWHCWNLVQDVYRERFQIDLPNYPRVNPLKHRELMLQVGALGTDQLPEWIELKEPEELCVVAIGRSNVTTHVGLWTEANGGGVVHVQAQSNCTCDSIQRLRRSCWQTIRFFKWHTLF